jgi:hypothetical protein
LIIPGLAINNERLYEERQRRQRRAEMKVLPMGVAFIVALGMWLIPSLAVAHCDTMGGPVIETARKALEEGDVTPVLKWVGKEDEAEVRALFEKTLKVRAEGPEAMELADMYFFETLVRIHRAGEGAPYTGLKPEGAVEPAVEEADKALETGSVDGLVQLVTHAVEEGIRGRFRQTSEARKHSEESVEAGREFVKAYVDFTHYVERLHMDATATGSHHGAEQGGSHRH